MSVNSQIFDFALEELNCFLQKNWYIVKRCFGWSMILLTISIGELLQKQIFILLIPPSVMRMPVSQIQMTTELFYVLAQTFGWKCYGVLLSHFIPANHYAIW